MKPNDLLIMLVERAALAPHYRLLISFDELSTWPKYSVQMLAEHQLLHQVQPASYLICNQCEEACMRPLHKASRHGLHFDHFMTCDLRSDVHRIAVAPDRLKQWHISAPMIAAWLSRGLCLHPPVTASLNTSRWELGVLKGSKQSGHVVLCVDQSQLIIHLSGYKLCLAEVLLGHNKPLAVDRHILVRCINNPRDAAGDKESAHQRCVRLKRRIAEEKNKGNRKFFKTVYEGEGICASRLRQIVNSCS